MKNPFRKQKVPVPYLNAEQQKVLAILYGVFVVQRKMKNSEFVDLILSFFIPWAGYTEEHMKKIVDALIDRKLTKEQKSIETLS